MSRLSGDGRLQVPSCLVAVVALAAGAFAIHFRGYYGLAILLRRQSSLHALLRPSGLVGIAFGFVAASMLLWNGAYLLRRSKLGRKLMPGGRRNWMNWHVFTGLASAPLALAHSAFTVRNSTGGHALAVLGLVIISGTTGRYCFSRLARSGQTGDRTRRTAGHFSTWRRVHRWLALLLILLLVIHVSVSLRYASFDFIQDHARGLPR